MYRIGIDIGGTFTDIAGYIDGVMYYAKAPSSLDIVQGVIDGVKLMLDKAGVNPTSDNIEIIHIHGTTIATNALLERKGAKIGLLTTEGHRDSLELGRMKRSNLYDLHAPPETPGFLAPGRMRIGIRERIDGKGNVVRPLDEEQVVAEVRQLRENYSIEALAVCYLNSYINPVHEKRTATVLATEFPDLLVSLSSNVNPVFREYERTCSTAFDAYVRPKVMYYVRQLELGLEAEASKTRLHLMQSGGGISSAAMTIERPVTMFRSGPAAGVVAGRYVGEMLGRKDLITFDVGGTSTDVSLIQKGKVQITREGRLKKYPLRIPMIDLEEIGSGGGSIAFIDTGGGLHVGPESAGSVPGPACYDRGGDKPTSTDASIVLGYINPDYFADGTMKLKPELSYDVISELGRQLNLDKTDVALGIYRILVSQMAEAIKLVTVKRGVDPRKFTLVSFGGGGGIYAAAVAREIGIKEVLVPLSPGTLSAFGLLVSDFETDGVRSFFVKSALDANVNAIEKVYEELEEIGFKRLAQEGIDNIPILHRRSAEMRYGGQAYELEVPISAPFDRNACIQAVEDFHKFHDLVYGHFNRNRPVEIVNLRSVSYQPAEVLPHKAMVGNLMPEGEELKPVGLRLSGFPGVGFVETPVYNRFKIPIDTPVVGPAIIEQPDTTVVIGPDQEAQLDAVGNLIICC
jgi:N-methylhydantoinase A